jgi:hypothetical protein
MPQKTHVTVFLMKNSNCSLARLPHPQLLHRFSDLVIRDRRCTAEMLAVIAEVDQRKLWATHACPSMFAFCVGHFHMSEAVTAKRICAALTARRFPVIFAMVTRGELHLSAIHQLAKHLTDDNHIALPNRAKHMSSRDIEQLVAEIAPKPDVPSRIRALPRRSECSIPNAIKVAAEREPRVSAEKEMATSCKRSAETARGQTNVPELSVAAPTITSPAATEFRRSNKPVVALSPRRDKIQITVDQDTHDKLRILQDLLSHQYPHTDPAVIVSQALDRLLTATLKKKAAMTDRPRPKRDSSGNKAEPTINIKLIWISGVSSWTACESPTFRGACPGTGGAKRVHGSRKPRLDPLRVSRL